MIDYRREFDDLYFSGDPLSVYQQNNRLAEVDMDRIIQINRFEDGHPLLSVRSNDRSAVVRFRDFIHLPKKSVAEQRKQVMEVIQQGVRRYQRELDYSIRPDLERKLFGAWKYRDVTVGDLTSLLSDVEANVKGLPPGYGRTAFSRSQWERILAHTARVMAPFREEVENGEWRRVCRQILDRIKSCCPSIFGKLGNGVVAAVLFSGLACAVVNVGAIGAVCLVAGGLGAYAAYRIMKSDARPPVDPRELARHLVQAWGEEFDRKPSAFHAGYRRMMFASSGEQFARDLIQDLGSAAAGIDPATLHRAILIAFERTAERHAVVELDGRGAMRLRVEGVKHVAKGDPVELGPVSIQAFAGPSKEDGRLMLRMPEISVHGAVMRRVRNNETWLQADLLERARLRDHSQGSSLTGFVSVTELPSGHLALVFRDDRDLPSLSRIRELVAEMELQSAKNRVLADNINALLTRDRAALNSRLMAAGIDPAALTDDDFRINTRGELMCSLGLRPDLVGIFIAESGWGQRLAQMSIAAPTPLMALAGPEDRMSDLGSLDSGLGESSRSGSTVSEASEFGTVYRSPEIEKKARKAIGELVKGIRNGGAEAGIAQQPAARAEGELTSQAAPGKTRVARVKGYAARKWKGLKNAFMEELMREVETMSGRPAAIRYSRPAEGNSQTKPVLPSSNLVRV